MKMTNILFLNSLLISFLLNLHSFSCKFLNEETVKITINGKEYQAPAKMKLMTYLREVLHITSAKDGCSEGACGACSILIDGKVKKGCVIEIGKIAGSSVTTIEGFTERERKIFSYSFGKAGAVQCGFCTPGMVICAKGLIDKNNNPNRAEIVNAIRGNYCRCTGYKKIIDAIELAAKIIRENLDIDQLEKEEQEKAKQGLGNDTIRIDARLKANGSAIYTDDIYLDDMLVSSAIRTKYPRARILKIDSEEALKMEGIFAVFTAKDIPGDNIVGHLKRDWETFIPEGGVTHCIGDAIALVVGDTWEHVNAAKEKVKIDYEKLEAVLSINDALKNEILVHENEGTNILVEKHLVRGNADEVIKNSKYVVSRHYSVPMGEHAFIEPECSVAMPLGEGVFVYSSDQSTYDTRREISYMLGINIDDIIVENAYVGGAFGGKEDVSVQHLAALAAYKLKRPVKCKLTRQESLIFHPKKHPMEIDMTTACDENGKLTAMKAVVLSDTGAYASLGGPVLERACTHAAGPYNYQIIDILGRALYTNNPPSGAFRGFGVTQTCFATEMNINELASMVGLDPWEFRFRNAIRPGQTLPNGQIAGPETGLVETLLAVKADYQSSKFVGIACAMKNSGLGVGLSDPGRVRLEVHDGKVHIYTAASCLGQGAGTVEVQFVCSELGLKFSDVVWHAPNTATCPNSGTTSGSRQTLMTGEATRKACQEILKVWKVGEPLSKIEGKSFYAEYDEVTDKLGSDKPHPRSHIAYGYATHVCILNEDGTVKKVVAAHDVGTCVNPKACQGQVEGGVVMSLGYALTEDLKLKDGIPRTKFGTLGLFRADRVPEVESIIIEKAGLKSASGAIGIGEITSIPTAPAVASAYEKMWGKRVNALPIKGTPYKK